MPSDDNNATLPREQINNPFTPKPKVQISNAQLNWIRATEGIGMESLDNEYTQNMGNHASEIKVLEPQSPEIRMPQSGSISFQKVEIVPQSTPNSSTTGSSETNLGQVAVASVTETTTKVLEKSTDVAVNTTKDVWEASSEIAKWIIGTENITYTTNNQTAPKAENKSGSNSTSIEAQVKIKQIHAFLENTSTGQELARREETTKIALRIIEKPALSEEDAKLLGVNESYVHNINNINAITSLAAKYTEIRIAQKKQATAHSISETGGGHGKGVIRQDNINEGGNAQLSVTGGGAPG